jgi:hypothetical protein
MIDRLPRLAAELPDLTRYLLEYPNATLANSTDFLYWQQTQFGLKPTVRIDHLVIQDRPARGPGFWLVTVNRSRADRLSGLTGPLFRHSALTTRQRDAHRTPDFISSPRLGPAPAFSEPTS